MSEWGPGLTFTKNVSRGQRPIPDNIQYSRERDIHVPDGIRTWNLSKQAASYPRLTGYLLYNFSDCFFRTLDMSPGVWRRLHICILCRCAKCSAKFPNCLNVRDARTDQCTRQKHKLNTRQSVKVKRSTSTVKKLFFSIKFIIKRQPIYNFKFSNDVQRSLQVSIQFILYHIPLKGDRSCLADSEQR
jgi:hypothetical protein